MNGMTDGAKPTPHHVHDWISRMDGSRSCRICGTITEGARIDKSLADAEPLHKILP